MPSVRGGPGRGETPPSQGEYPVQGRGEGPERRGGPRWHWRPLRNAAVPRACIAHEPRPPSRPPAPALELKQAPEAWTFSSPLGPPVPGQEAQRRTQKASPQNSMLEPYRPVSQDVTLFGERAFKDEIKLKCGHGRQGGGAPDPV